MNLHATVSGAIGSVNPFITVTIQQSQGYATAADGSRAPAYATSVSMSAQMQALTYNDLQHLDGLNIQGVRRALYINGTWNGVVRSKEQGGDLITLPDGSVWLCVLVIEQWDTWCKIALTQQDNS